MSVALTVQGRHDALVTARRDGRDGQDGQPPKPAVAPFVASQRTGSASEGFAAQLSRLGLSGPAGKTAAAQEPAAVETAAAKDDPASATAPTTASDEAASTASKPNIDALNRVLAHYKAQSEAAPFAVALVR